MVTAAKMRELALALPEVEEKSHFGQPDFRVRNKIFADISRDGLLGTVKLTPELQFAAIEAKPETFFPAPGHWGNSGWTHVKLDKAQTGELSELLREGWRLTAPKPLVLALSEARTRAAPPRKAAKTRRPKAK